MGAVTRTELTHAAPRTMRRAAATRALPRPCPPARLSTPAAPRPHPVAAPVTLSPCQSVIVPSAETVRHLCLTRPTHAERHRGIHILATAEPFELRASHRDLGTAVHVHPSSTLG